MDRQAACQGQMLARLDAWRARIDALQAGAEQKIRHYEEIGSLRNRQQQMREQLEALRTAGEGAWEGVGTGLAAAWRDLRDALERAAERFK